MFLSGLDHILVEASGSPGAAAGGGLLPSRTLSPPEGENARACFQIHLEYDERESLLILRIKPTNQTWEHPESMKKVLRQQ